MGVKLKDLASSKEINVRELSRKTIAIDAFNWIYQFLTTIRLADGSYLTDKTGEITSHLNGLFYRTMNLIINNVTPVFVFDGPAPMFKKATNIERARAKEEARKLAEEAETEEERIMYMKRTVTINDRIISSSKELLSLMGVKTIQAPAEGEAQAAYMNLKGDAYGVASQDYDALLFGAKRLIRNLNITNKRKLPGKGISTEVSPQLIDSNALYQSLGISREQLILIALFVGTDYNKGVKGIGPKKAFAIVKKDKKESILKSYDFGCEYDINDVFNYFMNPNVTDTDKTPPSTIDKDKLVEFLCDVHSFSKDRIGSYIEKIKKESSLLRYD
ncbi:MAG: flap endonuclease-1 [Candidatus Parvarchaeota archaeon]|nr:flap endonuclease-1 [Candidatus Parvarchaeota archaeon]